MEEYETDIAFAAWFVMMIFDKTIPRKAPIRKGGR
jgi:hypothetical protein